MSRSIREALGIAYFRIRRWGEAEAEFRKLLETEQKVWTKVVQDSGAKASE